VSVYICFWPTLRAWYLKQGYHHISAYVCIHINVSASIFSPTYCWASMMPKEVNAGHASAAALVARKAVNKKQVSNKQTMRVQAYKWHPN